MTTPPPSSSWAIIWRSVIVSLLAPTPPRVWHAHGSLWHVVYADDPQAANEKRHRNPRKTTT